MPAARVSKEIEVDGRRLALSRLDKLLYPEAGFTKAAVIDYYSRIAPVLLPHLAGRPLTLRRFPDGVQGKSFYEKRCPGHRPDWVGTATVTTPGRGTRIDFCVVEDLPSLVWAANLAALELHTSLSRATAMSSPTAIVFDLDPGEPAAALECAEVALRLRDLLKSLKLQSLVKSSGSKGLQVYVPLNDDGAAYERCKPFAHAVARLLERDLPELVVSTMAKQLRVGKVFVDWSQNSETKTTVCVYSLRARPTPTVSTPLTWQEVEGATSPDDLRFEAADVLDRAALNGDLFADLLELRQRLPELAEAP